MHGVMPTCSCVKPTAKRMGRHTTAIRSLHKVSCLHKFAISLELVMDFMLAVACEAWQTLF